MCGIAGIFNFRSQQPVRQGEISRMCLTMTYRGPDDMSEYAEGPVGLGHLRLAIIDTSAAANQPMANVSNDAIIIFNGEIYNYLELKKKLVSDGYQFNNESDTEVILQMYMKYGEKCVDHFVGMFAIAIWDRRKQQLFLARDRVGIKPLYYFIGSEGIVFGSEIKAILSICERRPSINMAMLDSYMSLGYVPTESTMFNDIQKLEPGHYLTADSAGVRIQRYWDLVFRDEEDMGEGHYVEQTRELLQDAVRLCLRSDVPLGVFLSGGLDSSAVVALMHHMGIEQIKTFSVAWDFGSRYDETKYARRVSELFNTEHHEYFMSAADFVNFVPSYIWHMDEPVTEAASISLYYISKLARDQVVVALSGEGADEVFGGYPIYKFMRALEYYRKIPEIIRSNFTDRIFNMMGGTAAKYAQLSTVPIQLRYNGVGFYSREQKLGLYTDEMRRVAEGASIEEIIAKYYSKVTDSDVQRQMQYLDINTWLPDDLLIKADRMSMAPSLELRVPFLDHRLLEFSAGMPSKYRTMKWQTKYILKSAMRAYLPREIVYRRKMGFPTPLSQLFRGPLSEYARSVLDSSRSHGRGYFNKRSVVKLMDEHAAGRADNHKVIWQLLVLEEWHRRFIDQQVAQ